MNKRPDIQAPYRLHVLNNVSSKGLKHLSSICGVTEFAADAQAVILRSAKINLEDYPGLIAIARAGVGVDNIDIEKATARGIPVFYAPGGNANAVAELLFSVLGSYARKVIASVEFVRSLDPNLPATDLEELIERGKKDYGGFELTGKVLGIIGLGNIGRRVANGAGGRDMSVIGFDPLIDNQTWENLLGDIPRASSIEEVMSKSHIVSVHVNLTARTKHLINAKVLEHGRKNLILVNYARSEICDEAAVQGALDSGMLGGYVTDFPISRFLRHPKVLSTPHLGASTVEAEENCALMVAKELTDFLRDGVIENAVNFPNMDARPHEGCRMRLAIPHRNVPGMLKLITDAIGEIGVNIGAFHSDTKGDIGYCLADLDEQIDEQKVEPIRQHADVLGVRVFRF